MTPPKAGESEPESSFDLLAGDFLLQQLDAQRLRGSFSDPPPDADPFAAAATRAVVFPLTSTKHWKTFHEAFAGPPSVSLAPWYRSLGIMRGHDAITAVVEPHYVCLDWRSEVAAFYAFLDAPRKNSTLRVHFFGKEVTHSAVSNLTAEQRQSYLGYLVVREGGLPLVGRSVLKPPPHLDEATLTSVREPVHFYGQDLEVTGVPFMQQDAQFAVCAQIVAWMAHYTAFRRGILERRLIADFVTNSGRGVEPMRPAVREGMNLRQVMKLFGRVGFRTWTFDTPWAAGSTLPRLLSNRFPELAAELAALGVSSDKPDGDLTQSAEEAWADYMEGLGDSLPNLDEPAALAQDAVIAATLKPFLDSGLPVYAGTADHAMLVLGYSREDSRTVHWVHDDIWGPYLRADSLALLSREELKYQSGILRGRDSDTYSTLPPVDRAAKRDSHPGTDVDRAVYGFAVPAPSRAILPPSAAQAHGTGLVSGLLQGASQGEVEAQLTAGHLLELGSISTTLQMGIQFKGARRAESLARNDAGGVIAWSSMHLAEWVVVVQSQDAEDQVAWEVVYDGSSTASQPRLQCIRIGRQLVSVNPARPEMYDRTLLDTAVWPYVSVPSRVAKYLDSPPDPTVAADVLAV